MCGAITKSRNMQELKSLIRTQHGAELSTKSLVIKNDASELKGECQLYFTKENKNLQTLEHELSRTLELFSICSGSSYELPIIAVNHHLNTNQGFFNLFGASILETDIKLSHFIEIGDNPEPCVLHHEAMHYARFSNGLFFKDYGKTYNANKKEIITRNWTGTLIEEACAVFAELTPDILRNREALLFPDSSFKDALLIRKLFNGTYKRLGPPPAYPPTSLSSGWNRADVACELDIRNIEILSKLRSIAEMDNLVFELSYQSSMSRERAVAAILFINNGMDVGYTLRDALTLDVDAIKKKLITTDPNVIKNGFEILKDGLREELSTVTLQRRKL